MAELIKNNAIPAEQHDIADIQQIIAEWKQYKQDEADGKIVRLPCKVGDTVFEIVSKRTNCSIHYCKYDEYSCQGCETECDSNNISSIQDVIVKSIDFIVGYITRRLGKTVFITREAAEQALKELEGK